VVNVTLTFFDAPVALSWAIATEVRTLVCAITASTEITKIDKTEKFRGATLDLMAVLLLEN
jgi:hypothetical protein